MLDGLRAMLSNHSLRLHASLYKKMQLLQKGFAICALSSENGAGRALFGGTLFFEALLYNLHWRYKKLFGAALALRIPLAVTWLTVFRQLHILPESNTGERRIASEVHPHVFKCCVFDRRVLSIPVVNRRDLAARGTELALGVLWRYW